MIAAKNIFENFKKKDINFFCGVPDSILKDFCNILAKLPDKKHIVATNEGSAIALGIGYYLAKKKIPCIYLQNSGLSNAINPLISIADKKIYSIPLILLIGWRGAPDQKDEPQHIIKGAITKNLLKLLKIRYCEINNKNDLIKLNKLIDYAKKNNTSIACLIKKKVIISNTEKTDVKKKNFSKKNFLTELLKQIPNTAKIISTTGYTSRELNDLRLKSNLSKGQDFYMVGGMGHSSIVSLGYSLNSKKKIICLDGDGSLLMHMGALATVGNYGKSNFKHILLNNYSHESVGGQKTNSENINFKKLIKSLGYKNYYCIKKSTEIKKTINHFLNLNGPSFLEVKLNIENKKNISRINNFEVIKKKFMK